MEKLAASGWERIAAPAQQWLEGNMDREELKMCIRDSHSGGIHPAFQKDLSDHACGGGFSVGAGYGHRLRVACHEHSQHDGTLYGGDPFFFGGYDLRIILSGGSRIDRQLGSFHIFGVVAYDHVHPTGADASEGFRFVHIGTCHSIPLMIENFRNGAHTRTADAYKVNMLDL